MSSLRIDWEHCFKEQAESGLSIPQFCQKKGIHPSTFYSAKSTMKKRLNPLSKVNEKTQNEFVELKPKNVLQVEKLLANKPQIKITCSNGSILEIFL